MIINHTDIRRCLDKANEMAEQYVLYEKDGTGFHRSVDSLAEICRQYLNKKIRIHVLNAVAGTGTIRGAFMATIDGYDIYLQPGAEMNFCWKRFVLCKELFHVVLDDPQFRTLNIYQHIEDVIMPTPEKATVPYPAGVSEWLAEIAAVEFLFPYKERVLQCQDGKAHEKYREIAEIYKIPQVYVERYLYDSWMQFLSRHSQQ